MGDKVQRKADGEIYIVEDVYMGTFSIRKYYKENSALVDVTLEDVLPAPLPT